MTRTGAVLVVTLVSIVALRADDRRAAVDPDGTTPLHWAVRAGDVAAVSRLLREGANASAANRYGVTPLSIAAENGDAATIEVLLSAGADANGTLSNGQTMLMIAARTGTPAAIQTLIAHGAHVNAKEHVLGESVVLEEPREEGEDLVLVALVEGAERGLRLLLVGARELDERAVVRLRERRLGHGRHIMDMEPVQGTGCSF